MSKAAMNLQDSFLNQVRRENSEVRVLLVNGTLLRGIVKGFDNFTLILNNRNGQHLVYKHAIAQIVSHRPHVKAEDMHPTGEQPAAAASSSAEDNHSSEADNTSETAPRSSAAKPGRRDRDREQNRENRPKPDTRPKKEGFNTLDLSGVKLGDKQG